MDHDQSSELSPRKTPRQARSTVTVDAVLDGTIQVLLGDGLDRLTTTRVALRAGVSVGTLYQYFPNKQALLYAVLERHLGRLADTLEAACVARRGTTADTMAEAIVQGYMQTKMAESEVTRALYMIAFNFDGGALVEAATRRGEHAIASMLSTASDRTFADPHIAAQTMLAAVSGAIRAIYERNQPADAARAVTLQLVVMCSAYLNAANLTSCLAAKLGHLSLASPQSNGKVL